MPIKGTWRDKINSDNAYDLLVKMNNCIRERELASNYKPCVIDGFLSIEDCRIRCGLYSEYDGHCGWNYYCGKCIQDFLNEQSK